MAAPTHQHARAVAPWAATAVIASGLFLGVLAGGTAGGSSPAGKTQAKKALLVLSDMPKGWKSTSSSGEGNNNFPGAKQLAGCIGVASSLIDSNPPEVDSPDFHSSNQSLEVDDSVSIFHSSKLADEEYAAISNAKTPTCMATLMNGPFKAEIASSGGKGTTVGTITVDHSSSPKGTSAFAVGLPITTQGVSVLAKLTIVYFVRGQLGQQITYYGYGPTFPASLEKHLTTVALRRL
jgi:hypothetical protein